MQVEGKAVIANILKAEGVECFTFFPLNPLIDACAALGMRPYMARTERVAINMADGYSRISGGKRIGVAMMQGNPGIENSFSGVSFAFADNSPVLILPHHVGRHRLGIPPDFTATNSYRGVTKWVDQINLVERIPEMMRRAFTKLRTGKRGPVMLEVPEDIMNANLDDSSFKYTPVRARRWEADPQDVKELVAAVLAARSPIIQAGQGVLYAEATAELVELAELLQAAVTTTLPGKSAFPEDHPLYCGSGSRTASKAVAHFFKKADLFFGVGTSLTNNSYNAPMPAGKTYAQVTVDESDVNKDVAVSYGAVGDAKLVLRQIIDEVKRQAGSNGRKGNPGVVNEVKAVRAEWLKEWMPRLTSNDTPISPYRVIWELRNNLDRANSIVTHDAGNPRDQMMPFYETPVPHGYLGWGKTTPLGSSIGLMIGARLAEPRKLCVAFLGDAAFGMVGMDFETAVRNGIPVLVVVLNNGTLGGYSKNLTVSDERYHVRRVSGNYKGIAEALGGYSERVEKPDQIAPALFRAQKEIAVDDQSYSR